MNRVADLPFDIDSLERQLADGARSIPLLKQAMADLAAWVDKKFYRGDDIVELVRARAHFTDQILILIWKQFDWQENRNSWRKTRASLIAVGGYGRGELHPHSDIDLLILLERNTYELHKKCVQNFITLLWDIGLDVGHSVRSIKDCQRQAKDDLTIMTALLESRTLVGDDELRLRMSNRISRSKIWPSRQFFDAKWEEQNERHSKFDHTSHNLEPNIKSSPGGLRDIQTLMWIARRVSGFGSFKELWDEKSLTPEEWSQLEEGERFLWRIRYGLHMVSGKNDNRLSFEYQRKLADLFGYEDNDDLLAVEQFMRDYYRTAFLLRGINQLMLQYYDQVILTSTDREIIKPLNPRFQIRNHYIEVVHADVFKQNPEALLEIFVLIGHHADIQEVHASTIRLIGTHVYMIDDDFRNNPVVTDLFMEILRTPLTLFSQLNRMKRFGILGAYLPEFGRIIGQMQFDMFHIYTVDAHTLQVIRNMRRFRYRNNEQRFPVAAHIIPRLPKIELLYIAGLYHDIAKGRGGDHSELGVRDAIAFCQRHRLTVWDANLVSWLVKNHLVMSVTAQRKDISDPEIIQEFAILVQDQVRLDYLYTLTVADINATNPNLWNSWRASLMHQLYIETKKMLRLGLETPVDKSEYVAETQDNAMQKLVQRGYSREQIEHLWRDIGEDYFLRESVSDIIWQTEAVCEHDTATGPLIMVKNQSTRLREEGATQIFVHCHNQPSLFAASVAALDQLELSVFDARIFTSAGGLVFNTYMVLESDGHPVEEDDNRLKKIIRKLSDYIRAPADSMKVSSKRTPRAMKQFNYPTSVSISTHPSGSYSILELITPDRPGLLAQMGRIFMDMHIQLQGARITTLGERVEDVFYVTDDQDCPFSDETITMQIKDRICRELDQDQLMAKANKQ